MTPSSHATSCQAYALRTALPDLEEVRHDEVWRALVVTNGGSGSGTAPEDVRKRAPHTAAVPSCAQARHVEDLHRTARGPNKRARQRSRRF